MTASRFTASRPAVSWDSPPEPAPRAEAAEDDFLETREKKTPTDTPALPRPMILPALQQYVARMVAARGFHQDPDKIFILLTEELGELATEFKHRAYYPERIDEENLGFELADILLYLLDLANAFSLSLMELWPAHEAANDRRFASRRPERPGAVAALTKIDPALALNELVVHVEAKRLEWGFEDTPERLMILLTEEVGEIATELRKSWRGLGDAHRMGAEIIDALTYLLRLAGCFRVDLEAAVTEKERRNAARSWEY
ncbi:MAG: hypothetical protein IIC64_00930 [SAR324 cluster bacterium]|nr:hypothetical protein [SAR324 cluster bacterium]